MTAPGPGRRDGVLARYESARSPLDLGPAEARIRARTRVSYVPEPPCCCARADASARSEASTRTCGSARTSTSCWRLDEAGWRCRYEPTAAVQHAVRQPLRAWLAQRAAYGRSAAPLALRHPGALAPVAVSAWSVGAWGLVVTGHPVAGVGLALRRGRRAGPQAAVTGRAAAGQSRCGWPGWGRWPPAASSPRPPPGCGGPLALPLALVSRRARRVLAIAALAPALASWLRQRPPLDPARFVALRLLDDAAYGFGVWQGRWRARTAAPLLPDLTSWPAPGRYDRDRVATGQ